MEQKKKRRGDREFFYSGSAAVCAIMLTNPMDVVRTRLQTATTPVYSGVSDALRQIGRQEGLRGLQRGLSAACLLQFSNVSIRFGAYDILKQTLHIDDNNNNYLKSLFAGGCSGALAAIASSPFFLVKNRFQAQSNSSTAAAVAKQYQYKTVRQAFATIYRTDGVAGFYKGLSAFVPRVVVASAVQLSTYDIVKQTIMQEFQMVNGVHLHFVSSLITGIGVVFAMQPFDFAATRTMNQKMVNGQGVLYKGPLDVIRKTIEHEGVFGIYKGAFASYLRFGPYCILVFMFLEQFRKIEDFIQCNDES